MTVTLTQKPIIISQADNKLIIKMQKSREVPIFICAPKNMGKTNLAIKYARQTYNLDEVLWIDGSSVDFKKAIENGKILEFIAIQIEKCIAACKLVVFDDIPFLSERACNLFSEWIDEMIEGQISVAVITVPENDCMGDYQSDRLLIDGDALIACGKWDKKKRVEVLTSFFDSELPNGIKCLATLMILFGRGIVDNLRDLGYKIERGAQNILKPHCPLIDIDERTGFFNASALPVKDITDQLLSYLAQAYVVDEGERKTEASKTEICFERLTKLSRYLFEQGACDQSQLMLELAGTLLAREDAEEVLAKPQEKSLKKEMGAEEQSSHKPQTKTIEEASESKTDKPKNVNIPVLGSAQEKQIQPIVIRLFGDFEVLAAGRQIEGKDLHRQKVRVLLIHLALNMGRGISRDLLMEQIWPEKDYLHAKDNFYSTWSKLTHLLSKSGRNCPYLSNNRGICKLENAYVKTDVSEFEQLSRAILFKKGSVDERIEAIYRIEQIYRGDILSGCNLGSYISFAQQKYRSLLVDVMLEASRLFSEERNDVNAVWFARKAFDTDSGREDVYRVLMSVQDRAGQRTSALQTYFDCKRYLSEELGILPSQKTMDLYQDLILDRR